MACAFPCCRACAPPPSLENIFKEIERDLGIARPDHGCLMPWARQGVLLLNAVLTVERGLAGSHQGKGWEGFTDACVDALNREREGLVFMLWGSYAQAKGKAHRPAAASGPEGAAPIAAVGASRFHRLRALLEGQRIPQEPRPDSDRLAPAGAERARPRFGARARQFALAVVQTDRSKLLIRIGRCRQGNGLSPWAGLLKSSLSGSGGVLYSPVQYVPAKGLVKGTLGAFSTLTGRVLKSSSSQEIHRNDECFDRQQPPDPERDR